MSAHPLQSTTVPATSLAGVFADPVPLIVSGRNWTAWFGTLVSLLVLGVVIWQLRALDLHQVVAMVPSQPAFWLAFLLYYCAGPISEWLIFRHLWSIPPEGFGALMRKQVSNELLIGYLGEVYFYAWARRHGRVEAAPFGAIKDVAILSAMVGNVATLAMLLISAPLLDALNLGVDHQLFFISVTVILGSSLAAMVLRRRLFSLPRPQLWWVAGVHLVRILAIIGLAATMWHIVLPGVALAWWLVLAAVRLLVSRLPLIPNKDVLFIAVAVFVVGRGTETAALMAMMGSLILLTHLLVGGALFGADLVRRRVA